MSRIVLLVIIFMAELLASCVAVTAPYRNLDMDIVDKRALSPETQIMATVSVSYNDADGHYQEVALSYEDMTAYSKGFDIQIPTARQEVVAYKAPSTGPNSIYASGSGIIKVYEGEAPFELIGISESNLALNDSDSYINLRKAVYMNRKLVMVFFMRDIEGHDAYVYLPPIKIRTY